MLITDVTAGAGVPAGAGAGVATGAAATGLAALRLGVTVLVVAVRLALARRSLEAASAGPATASTRMSAAKRVRSGEVTPLSSAATWVFAILGTFWPVLVVCRSQGERKHMSG